MRKIFAVILAAVLAVVGVVSLIQGITTFITPVIKFDSSLNTGIAVTEIIVGAVTILCLIGTIIALVKVWNRNKANERALFSLGIYVLGEGVIALLTWLAANQTTGTEESIKISLMVVWIISFVSGGLIFFASLEFIKIGARKAFGIIGTLIGIISFVILSLGLSGGASVYNWIIIIGGLVVSLLGFILSVTLKEKHK